MIEEKREDNMNKEMREGEPKLVELAVLCGDPIKSESCEVGKVAIDASFLKSSI